MLSDSPHTLATSAPTTPVIIIRTDSGDAIGTGHLKRCLSIATQLRQQHGLCPVFVCRRMPGDHSDWVTRHNVDLILLPENPSVSLSAFDNGPLEQHFLRMTADAEETLAAVKAHGIDHRILWVISDHLAIRSPWQNLIRTQLGCSLLAIDGLANYTHSVDMLLDPQISSDPKQKWSGLLPPHCRLFAGPEYIPLHPAFLQARGLATIRQTPVRRILVCFGGTLPNRILPRTIRVLKHLLDQPDRRTIEVDIIAPFPNTLTELQALLSPDESRYHLHTTVDNLADIMCTASLAIGAGGIMLWERCLLALPTLVVALAPNQTGPMQRLARQGAIYPLGTPDEQYEQRLEHGLSELLTSPEKLTAMSENARRIMAPWPRTEDWMRILKEAFT